jgi:hypothetical protein
MGCAQYHVMDIHLLDRGEAGGVIPKALKLNLERANKGLIVGHSEVLVVGSGGTACPIEAEVNETMIM